MTNAGSWPDTMCFVCRDVELESFESELRLRGASEGRRVLVVGEVGVGKRSLVRAFGAIAAEIERSAENMSSGAFGAGVFLLCSREAPPAGLMLCRRP